MITPRKAKNSQESKLGKRNHKKKEKIGRLGRTPRPGAGKVLCTIVYQYQKARKQNKQESQQRSKDKRTEMPSKATKNQEKPRQATQRQETPRNVMNNQENRTENKRSRN